MGLQTFQANRLGFAKKNPLGFSGRNQQVLDPLHVECHSWPFRQLPNPTLM
jgi:hypothetical protein